jgi:serralysin
MNSKFLAVSASSIVRRHITCGLALFVGLGFVSRAQAAFHLWGITEIYSNSSGTLQFIEMVDNFGGQNFVGGLNINVSNVGNSVTHTFPLPNVTLEGNTFGQYLLFGTAGLDAAGGPTPDYIIPDGFLFTAGGSISFFGLNSGAYTALPTDGTLSRTWQDGNAPNSPQNYAGQTGTVVPEPATITLAAIGGICVSCFLRRRRG